MLQRYTLMDQGDTALSKADDGEFYLVADVESRIAELERALTSCKAALHQHLKHQSGFEKLASDAYDEATKALSL